MRIVSDEIKIPKEEFGTNPFPAERDTIRRRAEEEAARDLAKHPRQLLADIHEESVTMRTDFVARTLARMASMQLRVQEEVERQTRSTEALNRRITFIGLFLGSAAIIVGLTQVVLSVLALCKQ